MTFAKKNCFLNLDFSQFFQRKEYFKEIVSYPKHKTLKQYFPWYTMVTIPSSYKIVIMQYWHFPLNAHADEHRYVEALVSF